MMRSFPCVAVLLAALLLSSCSKPEVTAYRAPKDQDTTPVAKAGSTNAGGAQGGAPAASAPAASAPAAPMAPAAPPMAGGGSMASTAVPTASGPGLTWTAPSTWRTGPASAMRKATYILPGEGTATAELSITAFPGDVGGEVANVNRWRTQIQLPPLSEAEIASSVTRLEANGLKINFVELANTTATPATRVLGAMVPHAGSTWFFKLTGPDALVTKEKPAFLEYVKSIKPGA